jgi:hypothetical protein
VHLQVQPLHQDGQHPEEVNMTHQLLHMGRVIFFRSVNDEPYTGIGSCAQCLAKGDNELCGALPDTCSTHHLHYEEVK